MGDEVLNKEINTHEYDRIPPGMLSSPQIEYYIDKYKIITNFKKEHLGSATYNMRIGGEVLTWNRDRKIELCLDKEEDRNKNIFNRIELKPNSLTFVTTIEEFRLTKDIIARYNLKSVLVHQGLLLGTGPIVDPQLHAKLLIPIHNFSNKVISLRYGDEIISVEFTKTLNPSDFYVLSDNTKGKFINNKSWKFDFHKYRNRIGDKEVASSVRSQFQAYDDAIEYYKKEISNITDKNEQVIRRIEEEKKELINRHSKHNLYGLLAVIAALVTLFIMSVQVMNNANDKADAAYNLVKQYGGDSIDFRSLALKTDLDDVQGEINRLNKRLSELTADFHPITNKQISALLEKISSLEAKTKNIETKLESAVK